MPGILLRWTGGGAGDTICHLLALTNSDTYMNFSRGELDQQTGRTVIGHEIDEQYPLFSALFDAHTIDNKETLKNNILNLIKTHKKFIVKCHFFDHEFDSLIKEHAEMNDIGFGLDFLPFIVQANIAKTRSIHPMFELIYKSQSVQDKVFQKIAPKLSSKQKKQVLIWNLIKDAVRCIHEFGLDNASLSTQDLFYNNERVENFFKEKGYEIDLDVQYFSDWKNNNTRYLPSKKYQSCLKNKEYDYTNKNELSIVERYIFLTLSGKKFIFLD